MKTPAASPGTGSFGQHTLKRAETASDGIRARAAHERRAAPPIHVTHRQFEVLCLLCEGLPNKLIARRLNIAAATVKAHIGGVLRNLGVANRLQAVVAARRLGLLTDIDESEEAGEDTCGDTPRFWDGLAGQEIPAAAQSSE